MATSWTTSARSWRRSAGAGARYMMMETSAYTREYRAVRDLLRAGELGELTIYRGFHIQNLDGFPRTGRATRRCTTSPTPCRRSSPSPGRSSRPCGRWVRAGCSRTRPPAGSTTRSVGDRPLRPRPVRRCGRHHDVVLPRARSYIEGFNLYGDAMGFEWPDEPDGPLTAFRLRPDDGGRGRPADTMALATDAFADRLPEPIRRYTERYLIRPVDGQPDYWRPAEHGGSHPHLVHEFVSAITESPPLCAVDAPVAAAWTAPGVVAHQSALAGGAPMDVSPLCLATWSTALRSPIGRFRPQSRRARAESISPPGRRPRCASIRSRRRRPVRGRQRPAGRQRRERRPSDRGGGRLRADHVRITLNDVCLSSMTSVASAAEHLELRPTRPGSSEAPTR